MHCPVCEKKLGREEYHEGEDEGSGDVLRPYAYWLCGECNTQIHDWDDEFDYPEWIDAANAGRV